VYSGLAMKKLCTLFVLLSLAASAGPAPTPTLIVTCPGGSGGVCSLPDFAATNLDPSTTYVIEGVGPTESFNFGPLTPAPDGTFDSGPLSTFLDGGAWTFELHAIGHNGNPHHKVLATYDATF